VRLEDPAELGQAVRSRGIMRMLRFSVGRTAVRKHRAGDLEWLSTKRLTPDAHWNKIATD